MSNVAPEHGPRPFGEVGDGGPLPIGAGSRPLVPHDAIGTVSPDGPESMAGFNDPNDPDRDMDVDDSDSAAY